MIATALHLVPQASTSTDAAALLALTHALITAAAATVITATIPADTTVALLVSTATAATAVRSARVACITVTVVQVPAQAALQDRINPVPGLPVAIAV